ncbi:MAG: YraN family protein [Candidatus Omnitrophica bacterium]|nr:YraN family protein [Candidatus Omnitrophota bacterium]MDD5488428.1 YraN family protein [Candidatus Omnitrophota bacterium]
MALERTNRNIGMLGEQMAARFMRARGFRIIERNSRTPFGEIDIICVKNDLLVFVEVKTRISEKYGAPAFAINRYKARKLVENCSYYMAAHRHLPRSPRIDVITVNLDHRGGFKILRHIINAIHDTREG